MAAGSGQEHVVDVGHFSYFQKMGPLSHFPDHVVHSYFIGAILIILSMIAYRQLKNTKENLLPDGKLSLKNFFELLTQFIYSICEGILGKEAKKYVPLLGAVFLYIFVSNCIGLVPGFQPPTTNLATNLGVALFIFLYYNYMGFKENGVGYMKHFMGPIWWLAPLIFLIEIVGHVVRPVSLSLRLGGNMTGDHMVLNIFSDLTPIIVPVAFIGLGLFVSFIQAFVFTLLSTIYIGLAVSHDH